MSSWDFLYSAGGLLKEGVGAVTGITLKAISSLSEQKAPSHSEKLESLDRVSAFIHTSSDNFAAIDRDFQIVANMVNMPDASLSGLKTQDPRTRREIMSTVVDSCMCQFESDAKQKADDRKTDEDLGFEFIDEVPSGFAPLTLTPMVSGVVGMVVNLSLTGASAISSLTSPPFRCEHSEQEPMPIELDELGHEGPTVPGLNLLSVQDNYYDDDADCLP